MIAALELFIAKHISRIMLKMFNKEGVRVFGDEWIPNSEDDFNAYLDLLYPAGVCRNNGELIEEI
jgi:hypothetical protein